MPRSLVVGSVVVAALACRAVAAADPPRGFSAPRVVGAGLEVSGVVAGAPTRRPGRRGGVRRPLGWGVGGAGARRRQCPLALRPVARSQLDARDVQVAVTERGEVVVVWAALVPAAAATPRCATPWPRRDGRSRAADAGDVGSNTGASARIAALRGGTVAVIFRDTRPPGAVGVLRYARRAPHGSFGPARSLGHDGVSPQIQALRAAGRCWRGRAGR